MKGMRSSAWCLALAALAMAACSEDPESSRAEITTSVHYASLPTHIFEQRLDQMERHILNQVEPGDRYAFPDRNKPGQLRSVELNPRPMAAYRQIRALRRMQQDWAQGSGAQPSGRHVTALQPGSFTDRPAARCLYLALDPDRLVPPIDPENTPESPAFIAFLMVPEDSVLGGPGVLAWTDWLRNTGARRVELLGLSDPVPDCRRAFFRTE